jgi:vitamin B12/bleomycin/antimicrobial peptide transport system ATP-binding/permease protein
MLRRFWRLAGGFWLDRAAWRPRLVAAGLLGLNATEVALLLRFNQWNRDLFDVLERRDGHGVLVQGGVLLVIAAGFAAVSFLHLQARRHLALHWRAWRSG